jgi:tetratricopeptide (TPR) repeat protein
MIRITLCFGSILLLSSCATKNARVMTPDAAPNRVVMFEQQVRNAKLEGEGDLELQQLRREVAAHPENADARYRLGLHYEAAGLWEVAVDQHRAALRIAPDNERIALRLGHSLRRLRLAEEAAKELQNFVNSHPQSVDARSALGICLDSMGDLEAGEREHRAALSAAMKRDELHNNLGYNLLQQGRYREAEEEFRQALALRPRSEIARNNLGVAIASQAEGNPEALMHLESVLGPAAAHNNLAAVLIENGKYEPARRELEVALTAQPGFAPALANLRLVASLDGKPASVTLAAPKPSVWSRTGAALKRVFVQEKEVREPLAHPEAGRKANTVARQ